MKNYSIALSAAAVALILSLGPTDAAARKIKCWTNKEGFRECGYTVPPEYAQKGHQEIGKFGTVEEVERAKTP